MTAQPLDTLSRDPDIAAFKAQLRELSRLREAAPPSIEDERRAFDAQHGAVPPAEGCDVEVFDLAGVRGERLTPAGADPGRALIYFHGGGYMFGSPLSHRHLVSRLAAAARVVAYNIEYRLAPEHPYPAGLDDAVLAYRHVLSEGFDAREIVVAGESAGGNLTAALLLKLRELGLPQPAGAYLLSPWLDMSQSGPSFEARGTHDPMITHAALTACSQAYRAGACADDPLISPVKGDLTGLPPIMIQVGADEVLLSDAVEFAHRAALAGVDMRLHVWADMVHAWPLFHFALPVAGAAAIAEAGAWIAGRLGREAAACA